MVPFTIIAYCVTMKNQVGRLEKLSKRGHTIQAGTTKNIFLSACVTHFKPHGDNRERA